MAKKTTEVRSEKTLQQAKMIAATEGAIDEPTRFTDEAISIRREHVRRFMARRVPQTVMAELLDVSRRTIYNDVQYWKKQSGDFVTAIKSNPEAANVDIGLTALRLEGVAQAAMSNYEIARTSQDKNQFLRTAIAAEGARSNLMINTGVLPKAGEELRIRQDINATFTAKLGENSPLAALDNPASRRKVLAVAEKLLRLSASKNNTEVIDAEVINIKPATSDADE